MQDIGVWNQTRRWRVLSLYVIRGLGIREDEVDPNSGVIALRYLLGATGPRECFWRRWEDEMLR